MKITSIDANIVNALERAGLPERLHNDSQRQSLTDMLRRNGPLQTIAFLNGKADKDGKGSTELLAALRLGLESIPGHPSVKLEVRALARLATGELLALSQRLTRVAVWINRLADSAPPSASEGTPR